jgi:hypothetical protein
MYSLFNNDVSDSDYTVSNDRIISKQWIRKQWKEAVMVQFTYSDSNMLYGLIFWGKLTNCNKVFIIHENVFLHTIV